MDEEKLTSNSYKSKMKEDMESVLKPGTAIVKKKSELSKFASEFVPKDTKLVRNYILADVVLPSLKKLIYDIVTNGLQAWLWQNGNNPITESKKSGSSRVSYRSFYDEPKSISASKPSALKTMDTQEELLTASRSDAEKIKDILLELTDPVYGAGVATLARYYELFGRSAPYTYYDYGWTDLKDKISVEPVMYQGTTYYTVKVPTAYCIKK